MRSRCRLSGEGRPLRLCDANWTPGEVCLYLPLAGEDAGNAKGKIVRMTPAEIVTDLDPAGLVDLLRGPDGEALLWEILGIPKAAGVLDMAMHKARRADAPEALRLLAHLARVQKKYAFALSAFATWQKEQELTAADAYSKALALRFLDRPADAITVLEPFARETDKALDIRLELAIEHCETGDLEGAYSHLAVAMAAIDNETPAPKKRNVYWMATYLEACLNKPYSSIVQDITALAERYSGIEQATGADVVFGFLDYKTPDRLKSSMNIGDTMQTVAAMRHLARRLGSGVTFDDPLLEDSWQALRKTWSGATDAVNGTRAHIAIVDRDAAWARARLHPDTTIWTVMNGWFFHKPFDTGRPFPLPGNVKPIFVSFYLQRAGDLTDDLTETLRNNGPVGCRDWSTVYWLLNRGIDAFFSGCMTLTLDWPDARGEPRHGRYYVDVDPEAGADGETSGQNLPAFRTMRFGAAVAECLKLLDRYGRAEEIVTSRLHCFLPSRAIGAPVTFWPKDPADRRFDGLDGSGDLDDNAIRARLTGLMDTVLDAILGGAPEDAVRTRWRQATADLVKEARARLETAGDFLAEPAPAPAGDRATAGKPQGDAISIALAFDQNLYDHSKVLIRSILANTTASIEFIVLLRGIDKAQQVALATAFPEAAFRFIDMSDQLDGIEVHLVDGTTISTMDRLFLPLVVTDRDRLVYLDVDTIVLGDVAELARVGLDATGVAGCPAPNPNCRFLVDIVELVIRRCGLDRETARALRRSTAAHADLLAPFFNAGVLVLDLDRLRADSFTERLIDLVSRLGLNDQEALNLYCRGQYGRIDSTWNTQAYNEWNDAPKLIHWPGKKKPWINRKSVWLNENWWRYAEAQPAATQAPRMPDWTDPKNYPPDWDKRAEKAAEWLPARGRIADLGCGPKMSLQRYLAPEVTYVPADMVAWTPEVRVVDLDKRQTPEGDFAAAALLGVVEYLEKPGMAFRGIRKVSQQLVVSYCHPRGTDAQALRDRRGWINAFKEEGLKRLLLREGWEIAERELLSENDQARYYLYNCRACEPVRPPALGPLATKVREERLSYLRPEKMARLEKALADLDREGVAGDFLEFGVALGGSAIVIADAACNQGRRFRGFDVFGMIPEPTSQADSDDARERYEVIRRGESKGLGKDVYYGYRDDLYGDVVRAFEGHGLPVDNDRIALIKGLFEETWPDHAGDPIAFAHIDCDWHDPVRYCLDAMAKNMVVGGQILIDDYHDYAGAKVATDAFLAENPAFEMEDGPNPVLFRRR